MDDLRANRSIEDIDRESVFHPVTSIADHLVRGPTIMQRASGCRITDNTGKTYLDAMAGLWCVNAGYGRTELAEAGAQALKDLGFFHTFASMGNEANARLADKLLQLLRDEAHCRRMARVFFANSGSEANDTAVKLARYVNNLRGRPQKKKIIARAGGYHGVTVASGSLTGIPLYHKAFDLPIEGVLHTSCPHAYAFAEPGESEADFTARLAQELRDLIEREGAETIAAFFAEPVMGTGGVLIPPAGYFEAIRPILREAEILLVADEVICGFGRLGSWFGSGAYRMDPDLLTFAKGVTSGYFPVSGVAVCNEVWETLADASPEIGAFAHGFTYSGHPVGAAIGLANLAVLERENLVENAVAVGDYFRGQLAERLAGHPYVGEVRGLGLIAAVELAADPATRRRFAPGEGPHRKVTAAAFERGLISRAMPFVDVNAFSPPLVFTRADADETVDKYAASLKDVFGV